ncbi:MAG: chromosomal replication initiator protein DnaA [Patescibacteria group bacterium]
MSPEQLWQAVLGELELAVSKANFLTWLSNTYILTWEGPRVTIAVPNFFYKDYVEKKYHANILKAISRVTEGQVKEVVYKITAGPAPARLLSRHAQAVPAAARAVESLAAPSTNNSQTTGYSQEHLARVSSASLNTRYSFDCFVVGRRTELAHAACQAVAQKPGVVYNPLFIYGGVGLGKTHLMQAVGHFVLKEWPQRRVLYTTCEAFTNEYVDAVKQGTAKEFQNKFRSVDVLLIDDIQFIAGKEGTQEAFFNTFDHLHRNQKQVVLTSDRPPKAIPTLENRMISRFEWGMIVDVGAPDLETKIAILNNKLGEKGSTLPPEVVQAIANLVQSNIRELEGALNKVLAWQQLKGVPPSVEEVKQQLASISQPAKKGALTSKQIINVVCEYFDVPLIEITGISRKKHLVTPRQIAAYLMRQELQASFPNIGNELGGRDHTTAMHAVSKIEKDLEQDQKIIQDIQLIRQRLFNS